MANYPLSRDQVGLLVVDVQDKLIAHVDRPCEIMQKINQVIKGFQILKLPILVTEQYPAGLGETVPLLKATLGVDQHYLMKRAFSCLREDSIKENILSSFVNQWVLVGMEAHICILQTARDLLAANKKVVALNDAITSRSIYDFSTAIAEMRDCGARISSTETVLFELLRYSTAPEFKRIQHLVQCAC